MISPVLHCCLMLDCRFEEVWPACDRFEADAETFEYGVLPRGWYTETFYFLPGGKNDKEIGRIFFVFLPR